MSVYLIYKQLLHPPVPLLIPRKALEDIEIAGFTVPKGAQVFVNVYGLGYEMKAHGTILTLGYPEGQNFELIPFGAGRRICPGLPLAIRMLYLMLGSLINSFDWKLEDENMDMEEKFGITIMKAQPLRAVLLPLVAVLYVNLRPGDHSSSFFSKHGENYPLKNMISLFCDRERFPESILSQPYQAP
ncbi:hypothetical protein CUMW_256170 [Citrus unshiu]|uniref:Cytochrome P450 n=1 Tax=Citrus unshiu TaxID=55188 RepID=A0A2H5QS47_CITUN|nr:hypothetical protein CUMW_256170 [Citrus unshiu]